MKIDYDEQISTLLNKNDLVQALIFINRCFTCSSEKSFNDCLLSFSAFLEFEFVLYCYTKELYKNELVVEFVNVSNPVEWDAEYRREDYLLHDPVRLEVERVLDTGATSSFILWDSYSWELSSQQQQMIERRNHFGLHHGFSFFTHSKNKNFSFLFSFAGRNTPVTQRCEILSTLLGSHLMVACKRLVLRRRIAKLSDKEKVVARWIMDGKTNWEIANILNVTVNTVKFHIKNIFRKLQVANRQQAIAVLLAERYLNL